MKKLSLLLFLSLFFPLSATAADQNFVTWVFPIRDRQYWRQGTNISYFQDIFNLTASIPSTWLIHYDVLNDQPIIQQLKARPSNQEVGLFLEVTRKLAEDSLVLYDWDYGQWTNANKIFLSAYKLRERQQIIDHAFTSFKKTFGFYPKTFGAWYVDGWSLDYIYKTYGANVWVGLADQYATDGYQEWGQPWDMPYYVSFYSTLEPAQNDQDNSHVVKLQWAPRHPVLGYGLGKNTSNFSLQVNDYFRSEKLPHQFFTNLLSDLTTNVSGSISQAVLGVEIGELQSNYLSELSRQIQDSQKLKLVTTSEFKDNFPQNTESVITSSANGITNTWINAIKYRALLSTVNNKIFLSDLRIYGQNLIRDNDQFQEDYRYNLYRVVPALIDQVILNNQELLTEKSDLINFITPNKPITQIFPTILPNLSWLIPDFRYSSLEDQKYFGLRINPTTLIGVRWPKISISKFNFTFPILEHFINLDQFRFPKFKLFGRQEAEIEKYRNDSRYKILEKSGLCGQTEVLKNYTKNVIFENGYYLVVSP